MPFPPVELLELCIARHLPFVVINHVNFATWWLEDDEARRYRRALPAARACYFVSEANWRLAEHQIGSAISNAEVVQNPCNVPFEVNVGWPAVDSDQELRLASVGRLHAGHKGQDILLQALAGPEWRERNWRVSFFGSGSNQEILQHMATRLGIAARVRFQGHVDDIPAIWADHHLLVMPSRHEGLPLALVEAMLCRRAVVATDVSDHSKLVHDGTTGFLASAATVPAFRDALERAWANRARCRELGMAAGERIRKHIVSDPVGVFVDKILRLATASTHDLLEAAAPTGARA
jgi:glycosyltransferase involved in cell wall biosynthesis